MTHPTRFETLPADSPMPLLVRRRVIGEQAMVSHVTLEQGCDVPMHAHPNEQFCYMLSGALRFTLGAEGGPDRREVVVRAGEILHLPANYPHAAFAIERSVVLDIFSPPSAMTGIDVPPAP